MIVLFFTLIYGHVCEGRMLIWLVSQVKPLAYMKPRNQPNDIRPANSKCILEFSPLPAVLADSPYLDSQSPLANLHLLHPCPFVKLWVLPSLVFLSLEMVLLGHWQREGKLAEYSIVEYRGVISFEYQIFLLFLGKWILLPYLFEV